MKRMFWFIVISLVPNIFLLPVHAQVVLDGTMGTAGPVTGPEYDIRAEYGQQAGANLFHSFHQFDINTGETASFGVSPVTQNIISRVTGGGSSWVDGTLRSIISDTSEISGANLYLLNPAGVMFGPNAALDLGGSFHVSTADYLRMDDNERFYVNQESDVLSASPPAAFGFLGTDIAPISFEGKGEIPEEDWDGNPTGLSVSEGHSISVMAGDITVTGTSYLSGEESVALGNLSAPGGDIRMASVASPGEVIPGQDDLDVSEFSTLGTVTLSDHALLETSGAGSGDVLIRAGHFFAENSVIEADTEGDQDGGITDIRVNTLSLIRSDIYSDAQSQGRGGDIYLRADESVRISDFSRVFADATNETKDAGDAGNVRIETRNFSLSEGSIVSSDTFYGSGDGGSVTITGTDGNPAQSITVSDARIYSGAIQGQFPEPDLGNGGSVNLEAETIAFTNGGIIASESKGTGTGGNVSIYASESLRLSGTDDAGDPSEIYAATFSTEEHAGNAGTISIDAQDILFEDGGGITTSTHGPGHAGTIEVQTVRLQLDDGAYISSESTSEGQGGDAGVIRIRAEDSVTLSDESAITTEAVNAGKGQIIMDVANKLYLEEGGKITTSIKAGAEDAGDVTVDQDTAILNRGRIIANAWAGRGGNIRILGNRFIQSSDGLVEASSELGIDGTIYIEAPEKDLSGDLTVLPGNFLDATRWMQKACAVRSEEDVSRFLLLGRDAIPTPFDGLLPSPPPEPKE